MDSGIYKLTFKSGHYYIGKSENIPKRWETHRRNFLQHKHTKRMQWAYNEFGMPNFEVLYCIHQDHIDLYENFAIQQFWDDQLILNSTRPKLIPETILNKLDVAYSAELNGTKLVHMSTLEHLDWLRIIHQNCKAAEAELELIKDESELALIHDIYVEENIRLEQEVKDLKNKLRQLRRLGWWNRLTKWYKYIGRI